MTVTSSSSNNTKANFSGHVIITTIINDKQYQYESSLTVCFLVHNLSSYTYIRFSIVSPITLCALKWTAKDINWTTMTFWRKTRDVPPSYFHFTSGLEGLNFASSDKHTPLTQAIQCNNVKIHFNKTGYIVWKVSHLIIFLQQHHIKDIKSWAAICSHFH